MLDDDEKIHKTPDGASRSSLPLRHDFRFVRELIANRIRIIIRLDRPISGV